MPRIPVTVLGATGVVGQRFVRRLAGHPMFEVTHIAASDRSAGKRPEEIAASGRFGLRWFPAAGSAGNVSVRDDGIRQGKSGQGNGPENQEIIHGQRVAHDQFKRGEILKWR